MPNDDANNKLDSGKIKADDKLPDDEAPAAETGGREGLEPTRYGDWEKEGRCIDF